MEVSKKYAAPVEDDEDEDMEEGQDPEALATAPKAASLWTRLFRETGGFFKHGFFSSVNFFLTLSLSLLHQELAELRAEASEMASAGSGRRVGDKSRRSFLGVFESSGLFEF